MLAALRTPDGEPFDLALTTNGSALRRLAQPLARRGPAADHVSPGLARRRDVPAHERRRLPGRAGARRHRRRASRRASARQDQRRPEARRERRRRSCRLARWARDAGHVLRFIEYMDVARRTAGASTTSCRRRRLSTRSAREWPLEPADADYRGRGRRALALRRRRRRDRRHRLRDAAVLRRLHPRPHLRRGQAVHVPVQRGRPRPARPAARGRVDEELRPASPALGRPRRSLLGAARRRPRTGCRRSRCSPSAADREPRPTARLSTNCPQRCGTRGQSTAGCGRSSWITPLTRPRSSRHVSSCPKGPPGIEEPRSHQGTSLPGPVASGASVPGRDGVPAPSPGRPGGT